MINLMRRNFLRFSQCHTKQIHWFVKIVFCKEKIISSPLSIHSVSPRDKTKYGRSLVNFIADKKKSSILVTDSDCRPKHPAYACSLVLWLCWKLTGEDERNRVCTHKKWVLSTKRNIVMVRIGTIERRQLISDCVGAVHGRAGDTAFYAQAKVIQHSKQ